MPILQQANTQLIREFEQAAFLAKISKGRDVFLEGSQVDAIALLISGVVRVYPSQFVDWSALPEEELLSGEGEKVLDQAIQNLSESLLIVFLLRDIEGLSIKETADALNLTETNVRTRLLRARMFLREQLSNYYREHFIREERK